MNTFLPSSINRPQFSGIYANLNPDNLMKYEIAKQQFPSEHKLRPYATRLFRELSTILGLTKVIGNQPANIDILGCSDGSEAYAHAHAIAFKEHLGRKAMSNIKIKGIDKQPFLVEMGKTGYLVCTDKEKEWANDSRRQPGHPLANGGWNKYLERKEEAPTNFKKLTDKYPELSQITRDTVSNISIGKGMDWYQVKTNDLPKIDFEVGDMKDYVKTSHSDKRLNVYVLSNAIAYIINEDQGASFLKILTEIRNNNPHKEKLVVLGGTEHQIFRQAPQLLQYMKLLGLEPVSEEELKRLGVKQIDKVYGDIWRISPGPKVNLQLS